MTTDKRIPISERALMARINRKLAKEGMHLHKTRQGSTWLDAPNYYIVDAGNHVTGPHITSLDTFVADWHPELLKPYEVLLEALPLEDIAKDWGDEVRLDGLGLDKFDTSTPEGKAGFDARCAVIKRELALTEEVRRRLAAEIRKIKKNENK